MSGLIPALRAASVAFKQYGDGARQRTIEEKGRERVSLEDFLTTPGVIVQAEYDKAVAAAIANNGVLSISSGSYAFDTLNMAAQDLTVECGPEVTFHHTGTGEGLTFDGGTGGQGIFNFTLRGNPLVVGNTNTTDGYYIRAIHHSDIKGRAADVTTGVNVEFAVCTKFHVTCSVNEHAFTRTPTRGLATGKRGDGEYVQDCTFYVIIEGVSGVGVDLDYTIGCEFKGTSEGNAKGFQEGPGCSRNKFIGIDLESNTISDFECYSENPTFDNCLALSLGSGNNCELITARGAKFIGGFWRTINRQSTSADTFFLGVATSDDPSLGFNGSGTFKMMDCVKQNTSGVVTERIVDYLGQRGGTWTPAFAASGGGAQGAVTSDDGTICVVGNLCSVQGFLNVKKGTLTGAISLVGFPMPSRDAPNDYQYIHIGEWQGVTLGNGYTSLVARISPGSTVATLIQSGSNVLSAVVDASAFGTDILLRFSGIYEIA